MNVGETHEQRCQNDFDLSCRMRESLKRGVYIDEFNQETNLISCPIELPELTDEQFQELKQNIKEINDFQAEHSKQLLKWLGLCRT